MILWEKRQQRRGLAPLLAALIPAILSAGGAVYNNWQNKKQADKQMRFQERMSSTAAQRSRADYEAAGLNPALAYERTASSPGGAMATMEDALSKGVNSAQSARELNQRLKLATAETTSRISLQDAQNQQAMTQSEKNLADATLAKQIFHFNVARQPSDLRLIAAQALGAEEGAAGTAIRNILDQYLIPSARNEANFQNRVGSLPQSLSALGPGARTAAEIINFLRERTAKGIKFPELKMPQLPNFRNQFNPRNINVPVWQLPPRRW